MVDDGDIGKLGMLGPAESKRMIPLPLNQPSAIAGCWMSLALMLLSILSSGCANGGKYCLVDRQCVSSNLACRFGTSLGPARCPREVVYPNGISLETELTEEAAVLLSLWNNAAFLELLTDLGIARGDLVQAGLLPNPELIYFLPVTDKPFKYALEFPLEAIWLRPIRVAAAQREYERVCLRLTQSGLDLIRDTRQAYADAVLARGRQQVAFDAIEIRRQIANTAKARLDAGDISPQEVSTALIDAARAQQDVVRTALEVQLADERLRNLMGLSDDRETLKLQLIQPQYPTPLGADTLVGLATNDRPDAQAARQAAAAAAERLRLSKVVWFRFLGLLDATSGRRSGHEFGPAFRVTLPIFNWNQGNIARAEAELEKAERQRQTIHNQIVLDVQQASMRFAQTRAELKVLDEQVRPEAETAIRRTEKAYRQGETPYVVVLQTTQQLIDSRTREVQLHADLRRAWADLERSVGRHLEGLQPPTHEASPPLNDQPPELQDAPAGTAKPPK